MYDIKGDFMKNNELELINKLFLELSQFATATTGRERKLQEKLRKLRQQETVMQFDPATSEKQPYPSHAQQWRDYHGQTAWLVNPWTGAVRHASDIDSDPFGFLIVQGSVD